MLIFGRSSDSVSLQDFLCFFSTLSLSILWEPSQSLFWDSVVHTLDMSQPLQSVCLSRYHLKCFQVFSVCDLLTAYFVLSLSTSVAICDVFEQSDLLISRYFIISEQQAMKRSTVIVTDLQTDESFGLGITVSAVDGVGVFLKSLMRNGPAERDGRLRVGDHISSIAGHSLEGATQADVDWLIQQLQAVIFYLRK